MRDVWGTGPQARYEKHAKYPQQGCGTATAVQRAEWPNASATGAFQQVTADLTSLALRHAWTNHTVMRL